MPNWNQEYEDAPTAEDNPSLGYDEFNKLKRGVRQRVENEHRFDFSTPTASAQAWHRQGSAVCYVQETEPTTRPDGTTSLTSSDDGRLWFKPSSYSLRIYVHNPPDGGDQWMPLMQTPFELHVSTSEPDDADGKIGDFWFKYEDA